MTKLFPIVTLLACLAAGYAFADGTEPSLPSDTRIKLLNYDEGDVYTISTKYGYQTNVVFDKGEEIQTISVGDRSLWQIIPAGNRIFIRPMDENLVTNMTVLTNKHSYQFDLKSVGNEKSGNIYVAKFVYPEDKPIPAHIAPPPIEPTPAPVVWHEPPPAVPAPVTVTQRIDEPGITKPVYPNYNYTFSGPDVLAPLQVYDDGNTTFIRYRDAGQPVPNAYAVEPNGTEKRMAYTVEDGVMAVDGVTAEIILRNSDGAIHVYNEMLNPK